MGRVFNKLKGITGSLLQGQGQIIIIGGTEVSIQLAERLSQLGQEIIIVEEDNLLAKQIQERLDCLVIHGLLTNRKIREKIDLKKADLLIALTYNDQYNLLAGIYAKQLGVKKVIIQLKDKELLDRSLQEEKLALDLILNPHAMAVQRVKALINSGLELELQQLLDSRIEIDRFKLSHQNHLAYQKLSEIDFGQNSLLIAIWRKGRALLPQGIKKLYPGDQLYLISRRGFKTKLANLIKTKASRDKLILAGSGKINQKLAHFFKPRAVTTIIAEKKEEGKKIVQNLSDILVLEGSILNIDLLEEEGIAGTDLFIADTTDQKQNLLAATLADKLGAKKTIAIVDEISYSNLDHYLAIDSIICPALLAVDSILDYLEEGQINMRTILGGQIKAVKITFSGTKGRSLKHLNLPAELLIVLIWRGEKVIVPHAETKLIPEDELLVLTLLSLTEIKEFISCEL